MGQMKNIILDGYPKNKEKSVKLIEFFKAILDICKDLNIGPVLDGSLAVFAYTKNKNITINDIDLSVSEAEFPRIINALEKNGIKHDLKEYHVLETLKDDLKIGFGSAERWSRGLPIDYETLQIGNHKVKVLSYVGLVKQYITAMGDRKKKSYEDAREGIKYLGLKERYEMLNGVVKIHASNKKQGQITLKKIARDPLLIASAHFLENGERVFFRPLVNSDARAFGKFLESLQENTRARFGPHPLITVEAKNICDSLNYSEMIRMILINMNQEIIGYMILSFLLRESQVLRYQDYKIPVTQRRDACIAPVVADRYQNKGVGSILLKETIRIAKSFGAKHLILWQGVQTTNSRAIHYYEKFGFKKNAEFDRYGTHNVDMALDLKGD